MLLDLLLDVDFFSGLTAFDADIARQVAARRCRFCGGPLHQANYRRKPRGALLAMAGEGLAVRHSLCCGRRGCRRRALPPSLRYLGRRVYLEAVLLLACFVAQTVGTVRQASVATGVPDWTLRRWAAWWTDVFPQSPTWIALCARFVPPPPADADLPRSLLKRLAHLLPCRGSPTSAAVCQLAARLLAPATTKSVPDGARFVRVALKAVMSA